MEEIKVQFKMSENVRFLLKPKQLQAVEMLAELPRGIRSFKSISGRLNISDRTLRRWKNNDNFRKAVDERIGEIFGNANVSIRQTILKKAMEGDISMIRFYYEHTEGWKALSKKEITANRPTKVSIIYGQ